MLLGGKAAGLAVMARELGLPVPPGFVVTAKVCREFLAGGWPAGIDDQIRAHLDRLSGRSGRKFGDSSVPLLVSVRSGAPVSMPGMMDTLLNVGMTEAIRDRLAEESGSEEFAADTWLRFNRMYAELVLGAPRDQVALASLNNGSASSILAAARLVRSLASEFGGIPTDPFEQLASAIRAVFASWHSERAAVFRAHEGISADLGTAATVQAMVFGNLDDRSGTGVAFTRDPATGAPEPRGDYLARAQGEDVVAGTHHVSGLDAMREQLPVVHAELLTVLDRLERHYRDMCDVEFTVSAGKLYLLQTRVGRRSPLAAVRIAVDMAEDPSFPLSRSEAAGRVGEETLRELANLGHVSPGNAPIATGLAVSPGVGAGQLCCDADRAAELAARGASVILARPETSPSDVHGMVASAGLVTTLGGMVSHAAVVARGWAIPAVCSLSGAEVEASGLRIGDSFFPEGTVITVDGSGGGLYLGDRRQAAAQDLPELRKLREWAAEEQAPSPRTAEGAGNVTPFEVLRAVQLKGLCTVERLTALFRCSEAAAASVLAEYEAMLKTTARGYALTPEGRAWVAERLAEEAATMAGGLEASWGRFMALDGRFKALVTEAQQSGINTPHHERWEWLANGLGAIHEEFRPVLQAVAAVAPRLSAYSRRFDAAIEAFSAGDYSMLASPLKDSYHTVWFEFHEELIALTGRDRATEEMASSH